MKIYKDIEQGSEEWFALRDLKMTASEATTIRVNGDGLETYTKKLFVEHITGRRQKDLSWNDDIRRGNELEPLASEIYELESMVEVEKVGFIEHDKYSGCSPDRLVGEEGGVEIKSPNDMNYYKLLTGEIEPSKGHVDQVQMCLMITKRMWWDLMYYNPNFKKSCIITRIYPDKEIHKKLKEGLKRGAELIEQHRRNFNKLT